MIEAPTRDINAYMHVAKVLEVYPETFTAKVKYVKSSLGSFDEVVECKIQTLKLSAFGDCSVSFPSPMDIVIVSTQASVIRPSIIGYYNVPLEKPTTYEFQHQLTPAKHYGSADKNLAGGTFPARGSGPLDAMPGDYVTLTEEGSGFGALKGGSAFIKAGLIAGIFLSKFRSTVTIVSRRIKIFSDFGELVSESVNGKASIHLRGNTDVKKTNTHKGQYDYQLSLGGDSLLSAKLLNNFSFVVDGDGKFKLMAKSAHVVLQSPPVIEISGDSVQTQKGSKSLEVSGDNVTTIKKNDKLSIRGSASHMVRGSYTQTFGGAHRVTGNSTYSLTLKGISPLSLDTAAYKISVGSGDIIFDIGKPTLGGTPSAALAGKMGGFKVNMVAGDFKTSSLFGNIELSTILGTAKLSGALKATLESKAIAELKANIAALESTVSMLAGVSGSTDPVVTALRLFSEINNKIIMIYNTHTHPSPQAPAGLLTTAPPMVSMTPLTPTAIANKNVLA